MSFLLLYALLRDCDANLGAACAAPRVMRQVEHFREAFNLFDTDGGGSIDIEELGSCLRSLGQVCSLMCVPFLKFTLYDFANSVDTGICDKYIHQNLNEKELSDMIAEFDKENTGTIPFEGFLGENSMNSVFCMCAYLHVCVCAWPQCKQNCDSEKVYERCVHNGQLDRDELICFADMLASHTADIDVDKEMVAAFCEFDTACVGRLDRQTFYQVRIIRG